MNIVFDSETNIKHLRGGGEGVRNVSFPENVAHVLNE